MAHDLLVLIGRMTVATSIATIIVMAVRVPLRRTCGCGVAYAAWLAVPLAVLATMLPPPSIQMPMAGVASLTMLAVHTTPGITVPSATWTWQHGAVVLWALGAIGMAMLHVRAQRNYIRGLGPLKIEGDIALSREPFASPCLVGMWRPRIVIPADFDRRYTKVERQLIVAHERAHAEARDPLTNLLCAGLVSIWWFYPLMHFAARLLREDQELARDADVMQAFPGMRRAYADAMLKAQMGSSMGPAVVCRWEPKHPLKERLTSLTRAPSIAARRAGRSMLALGLLCGTYAAWAEQSPAGSAVVDAEGTRPTAAVSAPARSLSDWKNARPSSVVTVTRGPRDGQFLVSARITDLETSRVLFEPRMLTVAGTPATMETGDNELLVRIVVTVNPSGREAAYTNEVRRGGRIESSQSAILVVDPRGPAQVTTPPLSDAKTMPTSEAKRIAVADGGQFEFKLTFSSTDPSELSCVADVFAAEGKPDLAEAMRASWDGKRHEAAFKTIAKTLPPEADRLVASLSKCQLGVDSKLTWSVGRRAA